MRRILPTPEEIIAHLDRFVRGQLDAKRAISKAVYFHYLNLVLPEDPGGRAAPEHCLLVGPTGSGKTLIVKTLAKLLDVPVLFVNASSLSSEGYVGESVGDMLARYARFCDYKEHAMNRGIIFLDEVDKLHAHQSAQADVRGQMVQEELLTLLDGNRLVRTKDSGITPGYDVDTSKILVIATGAFSGIDKIVANRTRGVGFRNEASAPSARIESDDIIKFGFLREFVARFPNLVTLDPLSESDLIEILQNPLQSPITSYRRLFELHGVDVEVVADGYHEIAQRALAAQQGARGLRHYFSQALSDVTWRIGALRGEQVVKIVVDGALVRGEAEAKLVYGQASSIDSARQFREVALEGKDSARKGDSHAEALEDIADLSSRVSSKPQALSSITSISDTRGWSEERLRERLEAVKLVVGYSSAQESAARWWIAFEEQNKTRTALILRLAEELALRRSTVDAFFMAYVYSNTDNIQANLDYLDYHRNCEKWRAEPQGAYDVREGAVGGLEAPDTRRLLSYDEGSQRGRLLWRCIEADCLLKSEFLTSVSVSLCASDIRSVDALFDWAVMARVPYVPAIQSYKGYVHHRSETSQPDDSSCVPREARPVCGGLSTECMGGDSIERRIYLLTRVAEGRFLETLWARFPKEFDPCADDPEIANRRLTAQFVDSECTLRTTIYGASCQSISDELALWRDAVSAYPGQQLSLAFTELVIAEMKPLLVHLVSEASPSDFLDVVSNISKIAMHLLADDQIIGLIMLYTKDAAAQGWPALIEALGSEYVRLHELLSRVQSGWRTPWTDEPVFPTR